MKKNIVSLYQLFPLKIDRACLKEFPDIVLGNWKMRGKEFSME